MASIRYGICSDNSPLRDLEVRALAASLAGLGDFLMGNLEKTRREAEALVEIVAEANK